MAEINLICADSEEFMKTEEWENLTKGKTIIMVTDPPFNIGYHYKSYKDKRPEQEYIKWLSRVCGGGATVMVNYPETLYKYSLYTNRVPEKVVSWVYPSNTGRQHRDIAFYGIKPNFSQVKQAYRNPTDKRIQRLMSEGKGARLYDWWEVNQVKNVSKDKTSHPCQMPLEVMKNIIGVLPKQDNVLIVDPFMGSGTTGVACRDLEIDFLGIDIDADYVEIAKRRIRDGREKNVCEDNH